MSTKNKYTSIQYNTFIMGDKKAQECWSVEELDLTAIKKTGTIKFGADFSRSSFFAA